MDKAAQGGLDIVFELDKLALVLQAYGVVGGIGMLQFGLLGQQPGEPRFESLG